MATAQKEQQPIEQRIKVAQQAKATADAALEAALAAQAIADKSGDLDAITKAEDAVADARRASDRYGRSLAVARRQAAEAADQQAAEALAEQRRSLAVQIKTRNAAGAQIGAALDALAAGVAAVETADAIIAALPVAVRGSDAQPGHNYGPGPLHAHLSIELAQRSIVGAPSSLAVPTLAEWLALGSRTLTGSKPES